MINEHQIARCGLHCDICTFREAMNCPSCLYANGDMFWGTCQIANCCKEKKFDNCSQCDEFPCDDLIAFSHDPEHGDNGERIRNLEILRDDAAKG